MSEIPTKTQPMREAIILALAQMKFLYPEDDGFLSSDIQFRIAEMAGTEFFHDGLFDDRSGAGKAYVRAEAQLREEGIVVMHPNDPNEIERTLAIYLEKD